MGTVKVANADRMIVAVVPGSKGIDATFADGSQGTVPFKDIPEVGDHSNLKSIELPNPYEVILTTLQDEQVELPWDFVRHYCDHTYRPRMEIMASLGRQVLGARVRSLREAAGVDPGSSGHSGRNREGHSGQAGKRETRTEARHAGVHSQSPGTANRRPAHGPRRFRTECGPTPQSSREDPLNINAGEDTHRRVR